MFKLKVGYFISGFATGLVLLFSFLTSLPDGKLHIIFCDVGQGDAAYVRFPDGRDMLVDGGPNDKVLGCLGRHMPFWDRSLDMVVLTHPEKDHVSGLMSALARYHVSYVVRSDVMKDTEITQQFLALVKEKNIPEKVVSSDDRVHIGGGNLAIVWPSFGARVLGAATDSVNEYSVVFWLRYGSFDALFTGDATMRGELSRLADGEVELLKVPHHGSRTGMNKDFLDWLNPKIAVISVGKNSYGHPAPEILEVLTDKQIKVLRTDKDGDVEVVSDGKGWRAR
jgi:competence protein ComEC